MTKPFQGNERGAAVIEFAFAAPVLLAIVVGVAQLGQVFFANAGLQHSVEEAARRAAVYPTPENAEILAAFQESKFGLRGSLTPTLEETTDSGMPVLDITATYTAPVEFLFFEIADVKLSHSRRVFLQEDEGGGGTSSTSSTSSSTSSTSSTSSGNGDGTPKGNGNGGGKNN